MELKDFVAETLQQIVEGTVGAQKAVEENKATINPPGINVADGSLPTYRTQYAVYSVQMIDFDISLVETEVGGKGGHIGVGWSSIGLGANVKSETGTGSTNRVRFSVPIMLPSHKPSL